MSKPEQYRPDRRDAVACRVYEAQRMLRTIALQLARASDDVMTCSFALWEAGRAVQQARDFSQGSYLRIVARWDVECWTQVEQYTSPRVYTLNTPHRSRPGIGSVQELQKELYADFWAQRCRRCGHAADKHRTPGGECVGVVGSDSEHGACCGVSTKFCECGAYQSPLAGGDHG